MTVTDCHSADADTKCVGRCRSKHKLFKRKKNTHFFSMEKVCETTFIDLHYPAGSPGNTPGSGNSGGRGGQNTKIFLLKNNS